MYLSDSSLQVTYDAAVCSRLIEGGEIPKAIALANAALPDDDPRKITARDVGLLRDIAVGLDAATDIPGAMGCGRTLVRIADKLAALLPPEPDGDIGRLHPPLFPDDA